MLTLFLAALLLFAIAVIGAWALRQPVPFTLPAKPAGNYRSHTPGPVERVTHLDRALAAREQARRVTGLGESVRLTRNP